LSKSNSFQALDAKQKQMTSETLEAAASFLQKGKSGSSSAASTLQYSVDESPLLRSPVPTAGGNEVQQMEAQQSPGSSSSGSRAMLRTASSLPTSPTKSPNKEEIAESDFVDTKEKIKTMVEAISPLPIPVRGRADTVDMPVSSSKVNKSLLAGSGAATAAGAGGLAKPPLAQRTRTSQTLPPPPLASKATTPSRTHSRDISDMTVDTLTGIPFVLPETDLGIVDSGDGDDDDDVMSKLSTTHTLRLSIVMVVTEKTLTSLKGSSRSQVSILRQIADLYNLSSYDMVTVNKIEKADEPTVLEAVSADFVTVTIKDQFVSRGDMHFFQEKLIGRWIYEGERLSDTLKVSEQRKVPLSSFRDIHRDSLHSSLGSASKCERDPARKTIGQVWDHHRGYHNHLSKSIRQNHLVSPDFGRNVGLCIAL
jgi:hypothetical protein